MSDTDRGGRPSETAAVCAVSGHIFRSLSALPNDILSRKRRGLDPTWNQWTIEGEETTKGKGKG